MTERLTDPKIVEQQEQQHAERNRSAVRRGLQVTSNRPMLQPPDFRSSPVHIVLDETDFRCLVAGTMFTSVLASRHSLLGRFQVSFSGLQAHANPHAVTFFDKHTRSQGPFLHRRYPTSTVI